MSKRTPRFFLRRFKRSKKNPYYHHAGYTKGGAMAGSGSAPRFAKSRSALRDALEAEGISVSNITPVLKSGKSKRRARRHHKKSAHRAKKATMKRTRRSAKSRIRALRRSHASKLIGRIFKRAKGKRHYAVKILGVRRGTGKKRKVNAVRWSGKRGTKILRALSYGSRAKKGTHMIGFTNPKRRKHRARRTTRRNPGIAADYFGGMTSAPTKIMSMFKGKDAVKNGLFAAGGAVGTFMLGGILSAKLIKPLLEKVSPALAARVANPSSIEARIVGGLLPYTAAFAITKLAGKKLGGDLSSAVLLGGAIASAIELIRPGMVGDLLKKVGLGESEMLAGLGALNGPVCGLGYADVLAGYDQYPSYAGSAATPVGEYVADAGHRLSGEEALAGYVEDKAMRVNGIGSEQLAGTYLDDAAGTVLTNSWLA